MWIQCCTKDEGRSLGTDLQGLVSNHLKLLWSKAMVVNVKEKAQLRLRQVRIKEVNVSEPLMKCREEINDVKTRGYSLLWDKSKGNLITDLDGVRHKGGTNLILALVWNVGTYRFDAKGEVQMSGPHENESTNAKRRVGATHSSDEAYENRWSEGVALFGLTKWSTKKWEEPMNQTKLKPFVISKQVVLEAYQRVKANRGSAGVDEQTIELFEKNLKDNLFKIWNRLSSGTYFPPAVRKVAIPKGNGGQRFLGIPTVSDRIAQTVVKMKLEPLVEPKFHQDSYGYRPKRSALDAVAVARKRTWKMAWAIDLDIKGFFDNIDHKILMRLVRRHTDCPWVLLYIERWLKVPAQIDDGTIVERTRGTPQGGVISPLLANIFLHHALDEWMKQRFPESPFERYADDIVVHCWTQKQAAYVRTGIEWQLRKYGLELHPEKTKIVLCHDDRRKIGRELGHPESFDFLGFTFKNRTARAPEGGLFNGFMPAISKSARKKISTTIRAWRINRRTALTLEELSQRFNPVIRGWFNYYGKQYKSELAPIYWQIEMALMRWATMKYKHLRGHRRRARLWLRRISQEQPELFAHWQYLGSKTDRTMGAV